MKQHDITCKQLLSNLPNFTETKKLFSSMTSLQKWNCELRNLFDFHGRLITVYYSEKFIMFRFLSHHCFSIFFVRLTHTCLHGRHFAEREEKKALPGTVYGAQKIKVNRVTHLNHQRDCNDCFFCTSLG